MRVTFSVTLRKLFFPFIAVLLVVPALSGCGNSDTPIQSVDSDTDDTIGQPINSEIDDVLSSGKPTIVQFSALENPCYKCIAMKVVFDEVKEKYQDRINMVLIDINKNRELAAEYEVMLVPTQLFYDINGNEVSRHSGYMHTEDVLNQLNEMGLE